ncbi:MAG: hypothetical protein KDD40_00050 [Bdellovibrionales bacterium]|nr:hypothetical protein [Bdellovibrionales bacterium]
MTLLWTTRLWAYEIYPEYRSLQADEVSEVQAAKNIDSEYQSDILTFQKPFRWQANWLKQDKAFDLSVGSLSSKRFAIENRLKILAPLNPFIDFHFVYFEQSDFEEQIRAHMLELLFWPHKKWGIAVYGEASGFKSEDDVGVAIINKPHNNLYHRWFYTATDFSRNQRNEQADYFKQKPSSFGWVTRWWSKENSEFVELALRVDRESEWVFPGQNITHFYNKRYLGVQSRHLLVAQYYLNTQISLTQRHEVSQSSVEFLKGEYQWQLETPTFNKGRWLYGLQYVDRLWRSSSGEVRHFNWLPHVWWQFTHWAWGYESTLFSAKGPTPLRSSLDTQSFRAEHRGNIKYGFVFAQAELNLLFTFDLDRLGTGEAWEGGNAQFTAHF